jgi:tyrosyl-tRNA synthetase
MKDFIAELRARNHLQSLTAGVEDLLASGKQRGYIGFDPTADSLHIGNLAAVMLLVHFQRCGHQPVVLVGGATGMVGDPSGKSAERNLLDSKTLHHNVECITRQLRAFLDFEDPETGAFLVNNYDWFRPIGFLDFLRDVGKHITVNYMMAKDSVQRRLESGTGLSFTEFSYQLLQGYDFKHLYDTLGVKLQMGGSDQFGNITTGIELVRRMTDGAEAYGLTCPLIIKADGTKFGKSESGNIWLDPAKTSPYRFHQFWLNCADEDLEKLLLVFSLRPVEELYALLTEHQAQPERRLAQNALADEVTARVHGTEAVAQARQAADILFGKASVEFVNSLPWPFLEDVFAGLPGTTLSRSALAEPLSLIELLVATGVSPSKTEARKSIKAGAVRVNWQKVTDEQATITPADLIHQRLVIVQVGRKNYATARFED